MPNPINGYYAPGLLEELHRRQEELARRREEERRRQEYQNAVMYGYANEVRYIDVNPQAQVDPAPAAPRHAGEYVVYGNEILGGMNPMPQQVQAWAGIANANAYVVPVDPNQPNPLDLDKEVADEGNVKLANNFMIGCDPEFIGLDSQGNHINFQAQLAHRGSLGWDHTGDVLEIRPRASKCAFTLMKRMKAILNAAPDLKGGKYRAGAFYPVPKRNLTLGGHVHIDQPFDNSLISRSRVLALDELTSLYEKLDILPNAESTKRRVAGNFGEWGDIRYDNGRTEYRTMASWLFHPRTTYLCLTGAKLAAAHPREALALLLSEAPSTKLVTKFFEQFSSSDDDARRVMEKIIEPKKDLQAYPDTSIQESWNLNLVQM